MRRVLPFLVLGTSVIAAEIPARLSPEDRAALEVATVTGVAGVRPIGVQKEPRVSVSTVQVTELLRVLTLPQRDPALLQSLVASITPEQMAQAIVSLAKEPAMLGAVVNAMAPADLATVVSSLARTTERTAVLAEMTRVNPKLELTLFALDIDHWVAVHHLLGEDEAPNSLYIGNWLGAWRLRLRKRIAQEGYSAEVMQEFERMKEILARQPVNRTSGSDSEK